MHPSTDKRKLIAECARIRTLEQLLPIAMRELRKFEPGGAHIVCGPISTGGIGDPKANLRRFNSVIDELRRCEKPIWSQMPYEFPIFHIREKWWLEHPEFRDDYYMPILEDFYRPLFSTGLFKRAWFIPGWESSFGASWERKEFDSLGIQVTDLRLEWVERCIRTRKKC